MATITIALLGLYAKADLNFVAIGDWGNVGPGEVKAAKGMDKVVY